MKSKTKLNFPNKTLGNSLKKFAHSENIVFNESAQRPCNKTLLCNLRNTSALRFDYLARNQLVGEKHLRIHASKFEMFTFQLEQFRMIYSHEGKLEQNVRPVQPIGKRYVFCPSDLEEEGDAEVEGDDDKKKEEDEDSSEEDKLDSEESSEEEDDDRKIKKRKRPQQPPLYARPKKLHSRPPTAFSYTLVSGWTWRGVRLSDW